MHEVMLKTMRGKSDGVAPEPVLAWSEEGAEKDREGYDAADSIGLAVTVDHIENPRIESEDHYYKAKAEAFAELGLKPNLLTQDTVVGMLEYVKRHKDNIDPKSIMPRVTWKDGKTG